MRKSTGASKRAPKTLGTLVTEIGGKCEHTTLDGFVATLALACVLHDRAASQCDDDVLEAAAVSAERARKPAAAVAAQVLAPKHTRSPDLADPSTFGAQVAPPSVPDVDAAASAAAADDVPPSPLSTVDVCTAPAPTAPECDAAVAMAPPARRAVCESTPRELLSLTRELQPLTRGAAPDRVECLFANALAASATLETNCARSGRMHLAARAAVAALNDHVQTQMAALNAFEPPRLDFSALHELLTEVAPGELACGNPRCVAWSHASIRLPPMLRGDEARMWRETGSVNDCQEFACILCTIEIVNTMFIDIAARREANRGVELPAATTLAILQQSPAPAVVQGPGGFREEVCMHVYTEFSVLVTTLSPRVFEYLPFEPSTDVRTGRRFLPIDQLSYEAGRDAISERAANARAAEAAAAAAGHAVDITPAGARRHHETEFF